MRAGFGLIVALILFAGFYWFAGTAQSAESSCFVPYKTFFGSAVPCSNFYDYGYPGSEFFNPDIVSHGKHVKGGSMQDGANGGDMH